MRRGRTNHPFVESNENGLGIGKLVSIDGDTATVEYFRSPVEDQPIRRQVAKDSLVRRLLHPETRAYYRNPETGGIEVGRILHYQKDDERYLVRFPNDQTKILFSDEFEVRCRLPIVEPTDHLAAQVNETAFWHAARSSFVRHLLEQQVNCVGLSALLSSSVEIVAHQVAVVRRVLMDPFQRYLLADEVGLGKTIEAGVLVKQFALDEPDNHDTLLIVPEALRVQWHQELTHRFHLGSLLGKSIQIIATHDLDGLQAKIHGARMIVIDEAHHLCSWAWSANPRESAIFNHVQAATGDLRRRVLLLSATPVLHNERSFLAMLHLLDPQVYPLNSFDAFKQRIHLRQEIAERMADLREDEQNYFLSDTLEVLGELLRDDEAFQRLREQLSSLIEQDVDEMNTQRIELIRSIRTHISDMWRLNRRILRSRRSDATSAYLPGRAGAMQLTYTCENETGLAEAIEAWRLTLSASLFTADELTKAQASQLVCMMEEFAACEPGRALDLARSRLHGESETIELLPLCYGEVEALEQITRAAGSCDQAAKLERLCDFIDQAGLQRSFVVFANTNSTANLIYQFLQRRLPSDRVIRHSPNRIEWTRFKAEHREFVLICDRSAEEGLNLQKRGATAIHFDLPFSPNRVEQRMGRLDRFGSGSSVQTAVLVCDGSDVQKRWLDLVNDGLGVFSRSIASLQYVIEDEMKKVLDKFLDLGADAFVEACERLGGADGLVSKELKKIRLQDTIDAMAADSVTQEFADELEQKDRSLGRTSAEFFDGWAVRSLRFRRTGEETRRDDVFAYEFTRRVDYGVRRPFGRDTLMPVDEFKSLFSSSIDELPLDPPAKFTTVPFTFDRVVSQRRSCRLLRVGDPFVDAFENFTRWDDRGISYAFWRHIPSLQMDEDPAVFFRFDFVVSPNAAPLRALCTRYSGSSYNAVIRRSHAIMAPRFTGMWLDSDLNRVLPEDERWALLQRPFSKGGTGIGKDYNLNRRRWNTVAEHYDMSFWRDRCVAARGRSERLLREQSRLPELSEECIAEATDLASRIQQQFRSRLALANGEMKSSLEYDLQFETDLLESQIEAFRHPDIRVDSVGAVFLSDQNPFNEEPGENNDGEDSD